MRVLFLSHMFPSPANAIGGIFVLEQMKALRELGVEIVTVAPTPWAPAVLRSVPRWSKYAAIPRRDNIEGFTVEYPRVLCFPGGRFFYLYGFFYYLRSLALVKRQVSGGGIDLIHAHAIMPDGFAGALLGRRLRVPVVCTVHGSDVNSYPSRNRATCWATKWALRNVGSLITVSRALEGRVFSLIGCRQIEVVHNGADHKKFKPKPREEARARLNLPIDKKIILFVGRLVPVKGVEFLLAAISRLGRPDAVLYLVGDGELRAVLMSMADRLGVLNVCRFVGRRPYAEIPLWFSAADCLVLPSLSEGFPTILPEAMLCRVPIVATEVGGIPELLSHGKNGWVVPRGDVIALAQGIETMLSRDQRVETMVDEARRTALAGFTWIANAEKTLAVYRSAIQSGGNE